MELLIYPLILILVLIASFKIIAKYIGTTVCIDCYAKVKIRDAIKAQMRNKDMYRCRKCSDKVRFSM